MENERRATIAAQEEVCTNVQILGDMRKVYDFFRINTGTSLDCMFGTKILRNSITWHISYLLRFGLLGVAFTRPDKHTGHMAQYYTADKSKWQQQVFDGQLSLWEV